MKKRGRWSPIAPSVRLRIAPAHQQALQAWRGKPVILGVRPEHLALGQESPECSVTVRVDVTEQLGSEIVLEATLADLTLTVSRINPAATLQRDDVVHLSVDAAQLHFFDPTSEQSLLHGASSS